MNIKNILKLSTDRKAVSTFIKLHLQFRQHPDYRIVHMIRCGLNIIKNDRLVNHEGKILVNSFIPPINTEAFENIAMQVPGKGKRFFENHINGVRLAPISTYIAATDKCMYHCWHCSAYKFMKDASSHSEFTTDQLKEVVKKLQDLGVGIIGFTGGEPLLRKDLEEVIQTIDSRSVSYIFTTGYQLTYPKAKALKKAGLFGIAISIDSLDKDNHNQMRGHDKAYDHAIEAIKNAKKAGLYTMSQTVCTRQSLQNKSIYDLALYLKTLGIDEMRIMEPLPCGALKDHLQQVLTKTEQKELIQLHIELNRDKHYPKVSVFPYVESEQQFGCGAGLQHSYVDGKGNFGACDFLDKTYGNLLEEEAETIWQKMSTDVCGPHCHCLAKYPHQCQRLPKFYRLMRGKK